MEKIVIHGDGALFITTIDLPSELVLSKYAVIDTIHAPNATEIDITRSKSFTEIPSDREVQVFTKNTEFTGTIISMTDDLIILKTREAIIHIRKYLQIVTLPYGDELDHAVNLSGQGSSSLKYMVSNINWNISYNLQIEQDMLIFVAYANIENNTSASYPTKQMFVSTSSIPKQTRPIPIYSAQMVRSAKSYSSDRNYEDTASPQDIEDITIYEVPFTVLSEGSKKYSIFGSKVKYQKLYRVSKYSNNPSIIYRFKSEMFMPSGQISMYNSDYFLGYSNLRETQMSDYAEISSGTSSIKCYVKVEEKMISKDRMKLTYTIKCMNTKKNPIVIEFQDEADRKQISVSPKPNRFEGNNYFWHFSINPGEEIEKQIESIVEVLED